MRLQGGDEQRTADDAADPRCSSLARPQRLAVLPAGYEFVMRGFFIPSLQDFPRR